MDLPDPGIEPGSPELQVDSLPSKPPGKPCVYVCILIYMHVCICIYICLYMYVCVYIYIYIHIYLYIKCSLYSTGLTFSLPVHCSIKVLLSVLPWHNMKIHLASLQYFLLPAS